MALSPFASKNKGSGRNNDQLRGGMLTGKMEGFRSEIIIGVLAYNVNGIMCRQDFAWDFGPGRISRARYSLTAFSVVTQ